MEDLISVVIPTYNSEDTILNCINSVINQTYKNWEIIIINDGSKDNTHEILNLFFKNNSCKNIIKYIVQENLGPSNARNKAIKKSKGNYIAFLDSDDFWEPNKLEIQLYYMKKTYNNIISAVGFEKFFLNKHIDYQSIKFNDLLYKNYFCTPSVIVKKDIMLNFLFDENKKYSEDYHIWLNILYEYNGLYINKILVYNQYRKKTFGEKGLSANMFSMQKGELHNFNELYKSKKISFYKLIKVCIYSCLKFIRRLFIYIFIHKIEKFIIHKYF